MVGILIGAGLPESFAARVKSLLDKKKKTSSNHPPIRRTPSLTKTYVNQKKTCLITSINDDN